MALACIERFGEEKGVFVREVILVAGIGVAMALSADDNRKEGNRNPWSCLPTVHMRWRGWVCSPPVKMANGLRIAMLPRDRQGRLRRDACVMASWSGFLVPALLPPNPIQHCDSKQEWSSPEGEPFQRHEMSHEGWS